MSTRRRLCGLAMWLCACADGGHREADASAVLPSLTREQLLDPAACQDCHPKHYREWSSSMHAYAARDPVFIAMNQRGQRETHGELGDFCVRCHAPMAVIEGQTTDGLNLEDVPLHLQGVTCYFCHNATRAEQPFNNHLVLAGDTLLRGGIREPVANAAHASQYSAFHDRNSAESAGLCGSCHDVVTPHGVKLERTYAEYQESLFGKSGPGFDTCGGCHMPGRPGRAAEGTDQNTPLRTVHEHLWPGVDVALTDFPDREAQRLAVACALGLNARFYAITLSPLGELIVKVETSAGHHQPSGTAQDRRLWLEVIAYDNNGHVLFESGTIDEGEVEEKSANEPGYDPQLTLFRDYLYDAAGEPVHMFWDAAPSSTYPDGYASLTLPPARMLNTAHTLDARYQLFDVARIDHIQLRLRMRALGVDVLRDLVASGDLDEGVIAEQPTFSLVGASVEWRPDDGAMTPVAGDAFDCPNVYRCLLEPTLAECAGRPAL